MLALIFFLAPTGAIAVKLPDLGQLTQAARTGDDVELERVGARIGAVKLERVAERGKREERLAALRALALVENGWAMLSPLSRLAGDAEPDVAEQAMVTARRICESTTRASLEEADAPRDLVERGGKDLLAQAARGELRPSVRVQAVLAAAALRGAVRVDEGALVKLLDAKLDDEPQVRRAAAEALGGVAAADKPLEAALISDGDASVQAAAGASLCRDANDARAGKWTAPAREKLRALALADTIALSDRLDLAGCLRVSLGDQKTLDELAKKAPESLKRKARALGGK
jgi:hypothetical protein